MGRKKKESSEILTETELKLMNALWRIEEGTVHQVIDELGPDEEYAYNTVSTIIRLLEQKSFLGSRKEGRSHVYFPQVEKVDYQKVGVTSVVDSLFEGTPLALIKNLLGTAQLDKSDLEELKELIDKDKNS